MCPFCTTTPISVCWHGIRILNLPNESSFYPQSAPKLFGTRGPDPHGSGKLRHPRAATTPGGGRLVSSRPPCIERGPQQVPDPDHARKPVPPCRGGRRLHTHRIDRRPPDDESLAAARGPETDRRVVAAQSPAAPRPAWRAVSEALALLLAAPGEASPDSAPVRDEIAADLGPVGAGPADVRRALRSTGGEDRAQQGRGVRDMPQNHVASGTCDRHANSTDGVGSLTSGPRTHPAHAEGRLEYKRCRTESATMEIQIQAARHNLGWLGRSCL